MFTAIYHFTVKPNQEAEFIAGWEGLTKLIYQHEGSLGSRLHHESEQHYVAYAQWPDRKTWEHAGRHLPPEADLYRQQMKAACETISTLHELEVISDLLKSEPVKKNESQ
jgi:heme-degrading monooxygenase HmoA